MATTLGSKSVSLTHLTTLIRRTKPPLHSLSTKLNTHILSFLHLSPKRPFSSKPATPFPLQYDMILSHPQKNNKRPSPVRPNASPNPPPSSEFDPSEQNPSRELSKDLSFEDWVDFKLSQNDTDTSSSNSVVNDDMGMDKEKRKYYNKRKKRMYGSDSEDEMRKREREGGFVELKPEVVEFRTLHKREEELYFYDAFALPWEKDKHYKMVYQLEKKYFPDHCLDKAFLEPGQQGQGLGGKAAKEGPGSEGVGEGERDKGLVFFEGGKEEGGRKKDSEGVSEKKVEEFFKCLKNVPKKGNEVSVVGPYLSSRSIGLPPQWDGVGGTVVLVNKPKGWTSFTVCGKLRRLTKVKKVGHAGTLDPMATGLLIVCVGKATKLADKYQGMIKGYSGVFRLGEATSTWDADSPVIQREPWEHIKDEDIKKTAASFTGDISQVPPMFSAIKVGGEKLYEKARRGESIELSPRKVSIYQFDIERSLEDRQNLIFRVTCSKGTYIRSLCKDFGNALGSCAHLTALRRDSIGEYTADDAFEFQELEEQITKGYL